LGGFFLVCKNDIVIDMQTALLIISAVFMIILLRREMRRNLTEESFISIVNHTFRTPLTRMKWMSETLEQEIPRKEQIEISKSLAASVSRLLEIIDTLTGIKDINNSSSYDLKAVSIREIIEEAIKKYGAEINARKITLEVSSLISFVVQVILENAIMYSKDGGKISIGAIVKNGQLILGINDEGIGLNWKERNNIFKRFYRSEDAKKMNTDGMGLGLYMAREIVKRHNGKINVTSGGKDKGSTFYIKLPISIA
jgi:signal transduction histidine kinase